MQSIIYIIWQIIILRMKKHIWNFHFVYNINLFVTVSFFSENPLEGTKKIVAKDNARITYFIQIVPVTYTDFYGNPVLHTYKYAVKESYVPVVVGAGVFRQPGSILSHTLSVMLFLSFLAWCEWFLECAYTWTFSPTSGVFFRYEISPYRVYQRAVAPPFSHIFAMCCAAIGGVLTFFGILSRPVAKIVETAFPALREGNDNIDPQVVEKASAKSTLHRRKVEADFTANASSLETLTTPVPLQESYNNASNMQKPEQVPLLHENDKAE